VPHWHAAGHRHAVAAAAARACAGQVWGLAKLSSRTCTRTRTHTPTHAHPMRAACARGTNAVQVCVRRLPRPCARCASTACVACWHTLCAEGGSCCPYYYTEATCLTPRPIHRRTRSPRGHCHHGRAQPGGRPARGGPDKVSSTRASVAWGVVVAVLTRLWPSIPYTHHKYQPRPPWFGCSTSYTHYKYQPKHHLRPPWFGCSTPYTHYKYQPTTVGACTRPPRRLRAQV